LLIDVSIVTASVQEALAAKGFALIPEAISEDRIQSLRTLLAKPSKAGSRGLLNQPEIKELASSHQLLALVSPHVPGGPRPVRALYFDKSGAKNWLVAWHQDLAITVGPRTQLPGFGPWSLKGGVEHVLAPREILEGMLTMRIHLDDCDESNGALKVAPGTHLRGRLSAEQIQEFRRKIPEQVCCAKAGDALLMRPLLLHASGRSQGTGSRRVLHIEYSAATLPTPLKWAA
jgi:hypothetical protein